MNDAIIVAFISLAGVVTTAFVQNRSFTNTFLEQSKLADAEMDKKISVYTAKTDTKIDELTREVREHNHFAQKIPLLEKQIEILEKNINSRERT